MEIMKPPHVSHIEWCCTNLSRSEQFYGQLFGWHFKRHGQRYSLYTPEHGPGPCVGLMLTDRVEASQTCHAFIEVTDIRSSLNQALALMSHIVVDATHIPDYGQYAQITDPDTNLVGLFQDNIPPTTDKPHC